MLQVQLTSHLRAGAGGVESLEIEASTIRELFRKLIERYPGLEPHVKQGLAVSINGRVFRDDWREPIPDGAEVFLLPRISGG